MTTQLKNIYILSIFFFKLRTAIKVSYFDVAGGVQEYVLGMQIDVRDAWAVHVLGGR